VQELEILYLRILEELEHLVLLLNRFLVLQWLRINRELLVREINKIRFKVVLLQKVNRIIRKLEVIHSQFHRTFRIVLFISNNRVLRIVKIFLEME
jgi:hypothetical protein